MTNDEFIVWAREALYQRVDALLSKAPTPPSDDDSLSVSADAPAFKAGVIMRRNQQTRLWVHDNATGRVGFVDDSAESLGLALSVIDASVYLGPEMMEAIMPTRVTPGA